MQIYRDGSSPERVLTVAANPGLLRFGRIRFGEVAFLDSCDACVFDAAGRLYLMDLERKRVGTVSNGERFILMTQRYEKRF